MNKKISKPQPQNEAVALVGQVIIPAEVAYTEYEPLQADQVRVASYMQTIGICLTFYNSLQKCIRHGGLPQ